MLWKRSNGIQYYYYSEGENGEEDQNGDAETEKNVESNGKVEKNEAESTTKDEEPGSSTAAEADSAEPVSL